MSSLSRMFRAADPGKGAGPGKVVAIRAPRNAGPPLVGMLPELRQLRARLKEALEGETDGGRVASLSSELRRVLLDIERAEHAERMARESAAAADAPDVDDELERAIARLAPTAAERAG